MWETAFTPVRDDAPHTHLTTISFELEMYYSYWPASPWPLPPSRRLWMAGVLLGRPALAPRLVSCLATNVVWATPIITLLGSRLV